MLRPVIRPAIDPLAHKAAIDALHAQRAAYQRYARTMEAQRQQPMGGANGGDVAGGARTTGTATTRRRQRASVGSDDGGGEKEARRWAGWTSG